MKSPFPLSFLAVLLLFIGLAVFAAEVELTAEVPAEKWRALRLKGLTQGASLAVRVETSGPIRIILAREDEAQRFPKGLRATFSGSTERSLSFRIRVPVAGTYYVILDNRKGDAQRDVKVYVEALPARRPQPKPAPKQPGMQDT